jgi:thiamine biosynthesis lipoprotein
VQAVEFNRLLARVASRGRNFVKLLDHRINDRNLMRGPQPLGYARISLLLTLLLGGCGEPQQSAYEFLQGATMGTYYRVQFAPSASCRPSQFALDQQLLAFNQSLSTYIADSELSLLNKAPAQIPRPISERLSVALVAAVELWRDTAGAFDVTVGPLVNIWGFGPDQELPWPPSKAAQLDAAASVGMQHIELLSNRQLRKRLATTYIDLSAIAKGQAVDEIAETMSSMGCEHFLVDIGGEVRVEGLNSGGKLWRVGIEVPRSGQQGSVQRVLSVSGQSVATSGDYRNFRVIDGLRVDHVIDPRSGNPADNNVLSVTVVHPSAMWADAYATALMVLGLDAGLAYAESRGVATLILAKSADATITERYTSHMQAYLLGNPE